MEVYLIRHGIAADRSEYSSDEIRPLTEKGAQKTMKVATKLFRIGLRFDLILTSPLLRASQTASILQKAGLGDRIQEFAPLAPDGDIQIWLDWWSKWCYDNNGKIVALIGHQPDLGKWAEKLVWGSSQEKLVLKKAGVIGLELPEAEKAIAKSELFLLTSPKWLL